MISKDSLTNANVKIINLMMGLPNMRELALPSTTVRNDPPLVFANCGPLSIPDYSFFDEYPQGVYTLHVYLRLLCVTLPKTNNTSSKKSWVWNLIDLLRLRAFTVWLIPFQELGKTWSFVHPDREARVFVKHQRFFLTFSTTIVPDSLKKLITVWCRCRLM